MSVDSVVPNLTIRVQDATIYSGPLITVPHAGDSIEHDGQVVRVEAVIWNFENADAISVQLNLGTQPYTF